MLYISKGRIRLSVGKEKEIFNREKYNDGKWHSVSGLISSHCFRITHFTKLFDSCVIFVYMVNDV